MLKDKSKRIWKIVLFVLYCVFMLKATILSRKPSTHQYELRLFWSFQELIAGHPNGVEEVVQYLNNILLFIPFGVLLPCKKDLKQGVLIFFMVSCSIELAQFVFALGLAETDDVISNTIGGIIGFKLSQWIKKKESISRTENKKMEHKATFYEKYIKRLLDIILSGAAIICLFWLYMIIAILVRAKLGGPVLFKHPRPGKDEKIFNVYKFRSMTNEKGADGKLLPDERRLTPFGMKLRSTSLDEIPELFLIFTGKMSIVGPRPLEVYFLPYYTEEEHHRHDVTPGLTGWAQVNGRNNLSWEDKFKYDLEYVNNISFLLDCKIVLMTVLKVLRRDDVVEAGGAEIVDFDVERKAKWEQEGKIVYG